MPVPPAADELLAIAEELARAAGDVLRNRPARLVADAKTSPTDAVTVKDREAEAVILAGLARRRPGDRVVAEESGASHGDAAPDPAAVTWFVDPLDGTVNYLYGIPHYAVSVAAQWAGETLAGVVLDVPRDELYAACRGGGASRDGTPLRCTSERDPAVSLVATGFGYAASLRQQQANTLTTLLPRVRDIRRHGSAALDLCAVAAGQVDAFFEAGMQPWDWAAGALIATEAGARVGGLGGGPPGVGTTLAANPDLYGELAALLRAAGVPG